MEIIKMFKYIVVLIVTLKFFISLGMAQDTVVVTFPTPENQSVILAPTNIETTTVNTERNDWLPPNLQEITQTLPYTAEIQQSISPTYYIPAPSQPAVLPHYRSEHWTPYGYPEYGYPVIPSHANSRVAQIPVKYLSIVAFIGLLTLFAIIQGSMMAAAKRKEGFVDVFDSREKRDVYASSDFQHMTPEEQDIFYNDVRVRCIQQTICQQNRQLSEDLGPSGVKLAKYLTRSIKKSLKTTSGWGRLVEDAGAAGLRGEDCNVLYRDCVFPAIPRSREETTGE